MSASADTPAKLGTAKRTRKNRREKMVVAAMELFAERGYDQTSIEDIGQAADVTGPALYYHFANKEEIFVEAIELASRKVVEAVERSTELPATEAIDLLLETVARMRVESAAWFRALTATDLPTRAQELVAAMSETHGRRWRDIIAELRPDLPPALVVATHLAIRGMLLHATSDEPQPVDAEERIAFLVESARWLISQAGVPHDGFTPAGSPRRLNRLGARRPNAPVHQEGTMVHVNTGWTALGRSGRDQAERIGLGYSGETFDRDAVTSALAFSGFAAWRPSAANRPRSKTGKSNVTAVNEV